jgi:tetratricopeptide (TPR) repeat protein
MTSKQIQPMIEACLREPGESHGFPCQRKSEAQVRQAIKDFLTATPYPGEDFYRLACEFYAEVGTIADQCDILDRWKRIKGNPIEPISIYCQLGEDGAVSRAVLKENLEEGLIRQPDDLRLLTVAYDIAKDEGNWARRLFYALELTKRSGTAADQVVYGIECGRNAMPERAEEAFQKALELDPKSVSAMNGLAMCSFERMELVKAEELFRKSLKTERNDCAETMLAKIANIRKGEPWAKRAEARRKFWKHWADTELTQLSGEQRQKQMAEVVAGRR